MKEPPIATRREPVVELLYGERIVDPYRWLERGDSPEVVAWTKAQNELTDHTLGEIAERAEIKERLEQLLGIGQISRPTVCRTKNKSLRYFYTRREGRQNQPVLLVRDGVHGKDRVVFDPNALSTTGTLALDWWTPSLEGGLVAYGTSQGGSEESTLYVRDVDSGKDLKDVISRARYSSVCWLPGAKRFFYARYPQPGTVPPGEEKYHRRIYEHVVGQDPDSDPIVFGADGQMTDFPGCAISDDGRWLVVRVHLSWSKSELFVADTQKPKLEFVRVTEPGAEHVYNPVPAKDTLYVQTNEGAPRYAIYAVDPRNPKRSSWRLVVREHATDVIASFAVIGNSLLVTYLHEATSRLERFDLSGKSRGQIELFTIGASDGFSGVEDGDEAFFDFESFAVPPTIRRLDLATGKQTVWEEVTTLIPADKYAVTSRKAHSKDGTTVPYLMVHRKDVDLKSAVNPTLLYGYGGFNVSLQPRFSRTAYVLLEKGGIYAQANLRGGGEFGEDWHRGGQLGHKQNSFDDFVAVAEHMISERVTAPNRLAIYGRSNGGLLVAAAITQRPDLFRAAVSTVPLADMLRYHHFQIAKLWIPEYGTADNEKQFRTLFSYSPYHHVVDGRAYPATLLMTAEGDTRVDPMHARKLAALLQHATGSDQPILLRVENEAGHGAGKPISKQADEYADLYTFVLWQLGVIGHDNG